MRTNHAGVWSIVAAPSNLGLAPPEPGAVPGCVQAPEALREAGLHRRLFDAGAVEAGAVLPGRYRADVQPGRLRNHDAVIDHARRLADRLEHVLAAGGRPLVLGGDCSILLGAGLALSRRGSYGLVHIDGHTDFRHPGNAVVCASLAGEDLAAAIGLHWPEVADVDGLGPYFAAEDTVPIGCRADDDYLDEVSKALAGVVTADDVRAHGAAPALDKVRQAVETEHSHSWWLHLDVDVLDPGYLDAVDTPTPGGLAPAQLVALLTGLLDGAVGLQVTIFDPDLDPSGAQARLLAETLAEALGAG